MAIVSLTKKPFHEYCTTACSVGLVVWVLYRTIRPWTTFQEGQTTWRDEPNLLELSVLLLQTLKTNVSARLWALDGYNVMSDSPSSWLPNKSFSYYYLIPLWQWLIQMLGDGLAILMVVGFFHFLSNRLSPGKNIISDRSRTTTPKGLILDEDIVIANGTNTTCSTDASRVISAAGPTETTSRTATLKNAVVPVSPMLPSRMLSHNSWLARVSVNVLAAVAVASGAASMQLTSSILVSLASLLSFGFALALPVQERTLKRLGPLRRQQNQLRTQVNDMAQERNKLKESIQSMESSVEELRDIPRQLQQVADQQGADADRLVNLIQEQRWLHQQMKERTHQQILQSILSIVVNSDSDGNWTLHPRELERLIQRLRVVPNIYFHEKPFRELLKDDPTISSIMFIIRSFLLDDDNVMGNNEAVPIIFEFKPWPK